MSHHCIWKVSVKIKGAVPVEGSAIPWPAVGDGGVGAFPWPAGTPRVAAQILRTDLGAVSTRMPLTARGGRDRARGPSGHPTEGWARAALVHRVLVCLSETWFLLPLSSWTRGLCCQNHAEGLETRGGPSAPCRCNCVIRGEVWGSPP